MHHHYSCIRSRIAEPPKWFDEDGVPRFDEFTQHQTANIYARQVVLLRIECQNCAREFDVCMSWRDHEHLFGGAAKDLAARVADDSIHYGDPPNVECCLSGPTMNSVPRRVLQFWRMDRLEWERVPSLERAIRCDWADGDSSPATEPSPAAAADTVGGKVPAAPSNAEIPTAEEAREIALRFINRHFNNPDCERPRIHIPADRKRDDDLRLIAFIKWAGELGELAARLSAEAARRGTPANVAPQSSPPSPTPAADETEDPDGC